jgi:hypothetical protein
MPDDCCCPFSCLTQKLRRPRAFRLCFPKLRSTVRATGLPTSSIAKPRKPSANPRASASPDNRKILSRTKLVGLSSARVSRAFPVIDSISFRRSRFSSSRSDSSLCKFSLSFINFSSVRVLGLNQFLGRFHEIRLEVYRSVSKLTTQSTCGGLCCKWLSRCRVSK